MVDIQQHFISFYQTTDLNDGDECFCEVCVHIEQQRYCNKHRVKKLNK